MPQIGLIFADTLEKICVHQFDPCNQRSIPQVHPSNQRSILQVQQFDRRSRPIEPYRGKLWIMKSN
jgi:hypothetical protein